MIYNWWCDNADQVSLSYGTKTTNGDTGTEMFGQNFEMNICHQDLWNRMSWKEIEKITYNDDV